jgi:hypothetical protein
MGVLNPTFKRPSATAGKPGGIANVMVQRRSSSDGTWLGCMNATRKNLPLVYGKQAEARLHDVHCGRILDLRRRRGLGGRAISGQRRTAIEDRSPGTEELGMLSTRFVPRYADIS